MAFSMTKITSVLITQLIIILGFISKEMEATSKSGMDIISASPALLPYPTSSPFHTSSPTISSFFPSLSPRPSGPAESPYADHVTAFPPARAPTSTGEVVGNANSSVCLMLGFSYYILYLLYFILF